MASVFSRIVRGELPSAKVYEDDETLAFMDINPASRGHTLVICKEEHPDIFSTPPHLIAAVAQTAQKVALALRAALNIDGLNVVQNNGAAAGQVVFHYHVHLIPRWKGDHVLRPWTPHPADPSELQAIAEQVRAALNDQRVER